MAGGSRFVPFGRAQGRFDCLVLRAEGRAPRSRDPARCALTTGFARPRMTQFRQRAQPGKRSGEELGEALGQVYLALGYLLEPLF